MALLRLHLHLPDAREEDYGSIVRVALRDTTMEDALHPTVAEATSILRRDHDQIDMALELSESALDPRHRYSVWAHVDHERTGQIKAGDLITTQNVPVTSDDIDAEGIDVPLTRI